MKKLLSVVLVIAMLMSNIGTLASSNEITEIISVTNLEEFVDAQIEVARAETEEVFGIGTKEESDASVKLSQNGRLASDSSVRYDWYINSFWGNVSEATDTEPSLWDKSDFEGYLVYEADIYNVSVKRFGLVTDQNRAVSSFFSLPEGGWNNVVFVINESGDENDGKTMVFINGVPYGDWSEHELGELNTVKQRLSNSIRLIAYGMDYTNGEDYSKVTDFGTIYIDNIRMYETSTFPDIEYTSVPVDFDGTSEIVSDRVLVNCLSQSLTTEELCGKAAPAIRLDRTDSDAGKQSFLQMYLKDKQVPDINSSEYIVLEMNYFTSNPEEFSLSGVQSRPLVDRKMLYSNIKANRWNKIVMIWENGITEDNAEAVNKTYDTREEAVSACPHSAQVYVNGEMVARVYPGQSSFGMYWEDRRENFIRIVSIHNDVSLGASVHYIDDLKMYESDEIDIDELVSVPAPVIEGIKFENGVATKHQKYNVADLIAFDGITVYENNNCSSALTDGELADENVIAYTDGTDVGYYTVVDETNDITVFNVEDYSEDVQIIYGTSESTEGVDGDNDTAFKLVCSISEDYYEHVYGGTYVTFGGVYDRDLVGQRDYTVIESDFKFGPHANTLFLGTNQHRPISKIISSSNVVLKDGWNHITVVIDNYTNIAYTFVNGVAYGSGVSYLGTQTDYMAYTDVRFIAGGHTESESMEVMSVDNMRMYATNESPVDIEEAFVSEIIATPSNIYIPSDVTDVEAFLREEIVVRAFYSDGSEVIVSDYEIDIYDNYVVINYNDVTTKISLNVNYLDMMQESYCVSEGEDISVPVYLWNLSGGDVNGQMIQVFIPEYDGLIIKDVTSDVLTGDIYFAEDEDKYVFADQMFSSAMDIPLFTITYSAIEEGIYDITLKYPELYDENYDKLGIEVLFSTTLTVTGGEDPIPERTLESIIASPEIISIPDGADALEAATSSITSVVATYSDGTTDNVTDYSVAITADGKKAVVTYEGKTAEITLTYEPAPVVDVALVVSPGKITVPYGTTDVLAYVMANISEVKVMSSDDSERAVSDYEVTYQSEKAIVTYGELSAEIEVELESAPVVLTGISVAPTSFEIPNGADAISAVKAAITKVVATYSDGTSENVTDYSVAIIADGKKAVVTYEGKTAEITLTYEPAPVVDVALIVSPGKITVPYGTTDVLAYVMANISEVKVMSSDDSERAVSDYEVTYQSEKVIVTYGGLSAEIEVELELAPVVLTGITVAPASFEVPYGADALETVKDAIVGVTAVYNDGTTENVTDYTVTITSDGKTAVVTYGGETAEIALTYEQAPQPDENGPKVKISEIKTLANKTVTLDVILEENTGFSSLGLEIDYDSDYLTLIEAVAETGVGGTYTAAQNISKKPYNFGWSSAENITYNGKLLTLTFTVAEGTPDGAYPISISYYKGVRGDYEDGYDVNYDENYEDLNLSYEAGNIIVMSYTPGDINDDGRINDRDGTSLLRYLAGWDVADINEYALDTDGNGRVNDRDATHLLRYLAGWDVELH